MIDRSLYSQFIKHEMKKVHAHAGVRCGFAPQSIEIDEPEISRREHRRHHNHDCHGHECCHKNSYEDIEYYENTATNIYKFAGGNEDKKENINRVLGKYGRK